MKRRRKYNEAWRICNKYYVLPFCSHIDSDGNVWGCGAYLNDDGLFMATFTKALLEIFGRAREYKSVFSG